MVRCCAGFAAMLREASRNDRFGDLLGKLKAEVRVTTQTRKRIAAAALRILFLTCVRSFPESYLLVQHKNRRLPLAGWCSSIDATVTGGEFVDFVRT